MMMPMQIQGNFVPMLPDMVPMQCYPPSSMNGYEPQWMMPYPMTPQHSTHSPDQYFYPSSHKAPDPQSPSFYPDHRKLTLDNLHPSTTPGNLKELVSSAGVVTQCNMALEADQTRASITMQKNEDAQRAVTMFNNIRFMGSRISVRLDRGPSSCGSRLSSSGTDSLTSDAGDSVSWADEMSGLEQKACKPLVIDGSGKPRADVLCTSAPT